MVPLDDQFCGRFGMLTDKLRPQVDAEPRRKQVGAPGYRTSDIDVAVTIALKTADNGRIPGTMA